MSGNNVLLDTNIIAALFKGESAIANKMDKASAVYISVVVLGELYYGAYYSTQVQKNLEGIRNLISRYELTVIDENVTIAYGSIKSELRKKGTPIPENDIWIAATALHNNFTLVTRDKHFNLVDGITIKKW